jgi:hypothetical protein
LVFKVGFRAWFRAWAGGGREQRGWREEEGGRKQLLDPKPSQHLADVEVNLNPKP